MGAYLGLRDSWFWEDDAILDAIETLQDQADGTFYPAEYGPEGHTDIACPNLWVKLSDPAGGVGTVRAPFRGTRRRAGRKALRDPLRLRPMVQRCRRRTQGGLSPRARLP